MSVLKLTRQLFVSFVVILLLCAPQAKAADWLSPFKQLVSPTEAAEREAARAEYKARRLEKEAEKVNQAAEEARSEALNAKEKAGDGLIIKRSTSRTEPVKKETAKAPEPSEPKSEPRKEEKLQNASWQEGLNPKNWFSGGDDKKEETAEWSSAERPKVYREEALNLQAVHSPVQAEASKAVREKSEKLSKKERQELATTSRASVANHDGVVLETERGNIVIELLSEDAPKTVANFVKLVDSGFYNKSGMKFHRVVPGFVVQTGDPTGTGTGGSKERIPLEVKNKLSHEGMGWVGMARGPDPNSATSQFYITLAPQKALDGKYAIFGRVISGFDALTSIEKDNKLYGARFVDPDTVAHETAPDPKDSRTWKKWF